MSSQGRNVGFMGNNITSIAISGINCEIVFVLSGVDLIVQYLLIL